MIFLQKLFTSALLAINLCICLPSIPVHAQDRFHWICSSDTQTILLDTYTLNIVLEKSAGWLVFDSWTKTQYNDQGKEQLIQNREKHNLPTEGYENLSYTLSHNYYTSNAKVKLKKYKLISYIDYTNDGTILDSYSFPSNISWEEIVPESISDTVLIGLSNYAAQHNIRPLIKEH